MKTPKIKTLVIDDDHPYPWTSVIVPYLEETGEFEVYCETDGRKALTVACAIVPDLILLDWVMDTVDGPELMRELEKQPVLANTAMMFVTSQVADKTDAKFQHAIHGRWRYFAKDEDLDNLLARIANLLLLKHKYGHQTGVVLTKS